LIKNLEASLRERLLNIAKQKNLSLDYIVLRYMQEKTIYRLSLSSYKNNFVLKGGLFFLLLDNLNQRVTKDIDFLGMNVKNTEEHIKAVFKEILSIRLEDGLTYNSDEIVCERIKEDADYEGIRVNIICALGKISKNIQIDIGFGDVIYPETKKAVYPSLLDKPIDNISVYPLETVISEKFEAMLKLSYLNSRMKDFYDIYNIISNYDIKGKNIQIAITETLKNRNTKLETDIVIFREDFHNDKDKIKQWQNFVKKLNLADLSFESVLLSLKNFMSHIIICINDNRLSDQVWDHSSNTWISKR